MSANNPTSERPVLDEKITLHDFQSFYWLKDELATFCRTYGISATGSKTDLEQRIQKFLMTGEKEHKPTRTATPKDGRQASEEPLSVKTIITPSYRSDQKHREFFKTVIGPHFHFTTHFMNFFKQNVGKTYQDAIDAWYLEEQRKKEPLYQTTIAPQFKYNRYIREFLRDNPDKTLRDAIASWNSKKHKRGDTAYAPDDVVNET